MAKYAYSGILQGNTAKRRKTIFKISANTLNVMIEFPIWFGIPQSITRSGNI